MAQMSHPVKHFFLRFAALPSLMYVQIFTTFYNMRCDGAIPLINGTKQKIKYNKTPSPPPLPKKKTQKTKKNRQDTTN